MGVTEPTDEMVEAAARRMAQLDLPDSHTLDDRLTVPWQRYKWEAEQVLEAVLSVVPSAPTEDDREALIERAFNKICEEEPLSGIARADIGRWIDLLESVGFGRSPSPVETVTTEAELNALPVGTVFRTNKWGDVWEVRAAHDPEYDFEGYRFESTTQSGRYEPKTFAGELPATVLFRPSSEETGQ